MPINEKYYGIMFNQKICLDSINCKYLAIILFFDLTISANEARKILNNNFLIEKINLLCKYFDCVIQNTLIQKEDIHNSFSNENLIINKILDWIIVYSFPTISETTELCKNHNISVNPLLTQRNCIILNSDLYPSKILEYLFSFSECLKQIEIDQVLDKYNQTIDQNFIVINH